MASKRELWRTGFRPVPGSNALYIDRCGAVYDYTRQRIVKRKDVARLVLNGQIVNVPQLLLLVFFKQPIKPRRRVQYVDGNRKNLHADNLRYKPDAPDIRIDPAALMTAVRCYHQVPKSYKVNNYTRTRYYLSEIVARRYFRFFSV